MQGMMAEWSKAVDLSSTGATRVSSNLTHVIVLQVLFFGAIYYVVHQEIPATLLANFRKPTERMDYGIFCQRPNLKSRL